ncbi:ATP-binding protein [Desulfocicer niacini]
MFENPRVGTDRASTAPTRSAAEKTFSLSDGIIVITVQKANFTDYSGPFGNLLAGTARQIRRERAVMSIMELLCLGSLLVMGIYHLFLFLFRQKDRSVLYFSLICLLWAAYTPFAGYGGFLLWEVIPKPPLRAAYAAGLIPIFLGSPLTLLFLNSLYPRQGSRTLSRLFLALGTLCSLAALFIPFTLAAGTVLLYEWICLCFGLYCLFMLARAAMKKETGARIILAGIALLMVFVVNDILMDQHIIDTIPLLPFGILMLVLSHSLVLAKRFARAHTLAEAYAGELEEKNITLARMDRLKDEFLANTSHELRTPLHGIIGMAEAIRSAAGRALPNRIGEDLDVIISSARRLSDLINDILDFSRLSHAEIRLRKTAVDMRIMADTVLRVARTLAAGKPVRLINGIAEDFPPVWGDENRLQQILYNLVGNAVKFTEKGEVRISARGEDGLGVITVSDTGIGIAAENLAGIFEAFEQGDGSVTRQFGGTGLGLAVTRRLAELHGGTAWAESAPGKGASFSFSIPEAPPGAAAPSPQSVRLIKTPFLVKTPSPAGPLPEAVSGENETAGENPVLTDPDLNSDGAAAGAVILAIDDDPVNLRAVSRHLTAHSLKVVTAGSGRQGLRIIEDGPLPDLVLLDIMMPQMSGHEVLHTLRKNHGFSELPVIILTAKNPVTDLVLGFQSGANDYLIKPFLFDELMARIRFQLDIIKACRILRENADLKLSLADQRRKKIEARLQAQQTALEMLRFQLNPHFLFNALASIRGALLRHPETARGMVTALSEFCRLSLAYGMESFVPLERETVLVRHYLEIEKARQGDRMEVETEFDGDTLDHPVPAFLLQPLVENAVKYGRITSPEPLKIRLASRFEKNRLVITAANTGAWVTPGSGNPEQGAGVGLENIRKRLEKMYPGRFGFSHTENCGWVVLEIALPKNRHRKTDNGYSMNLND